MAAPGAALAAETQGVVAHRVDEFGIFVANQSRKDFERVSVLEPPQHWWLGKNDRVKNEKEPATFLVWGWTLNALVDEKSKLESLDKIKINDKTAFGIRVSETITPPMDLYFDKETKRLARIQWRTDRHELNDWKEADGA